MSIYLQSIDHQWLLVVDGAVRERVKRSDHKTVTRQLEYDVQCNTYVHAPVDVVENVTYSSWNFSAALVARNSLVNSISAYLQSVRGVLVMNMHEDVRLILKPKWVSL